MDVAWERRGLLLRAPLAATWATSHAALPHALDGPEGAWLYFSSRDDRGRSQIGRAELDLAAASARVQGSPILRPGSRGAFDDSGVTTSCLVHDGNRYLLYYTGWTLGVTVPFYLFAGCATSDDGEVFTRVSSAPILERSSIDPYVTASPWVLRENDLWRMWYVSGTGWDVVDGRSRPCYHIKYAHSCDGLTWERSGHVCIDFRDAAEYAISRPCVVRDGSIYRMWFSARGDAYRIGYAESRDGLDWERQDGGENVIEGAEEWDREMQAYPAIFDEGGERYLLYNGNGYGRTGIGWAAWTASR